MRVVESSRRRVVVYGRLENLGENAFGAALHLRHSPNLVLSSILVKVTVTTTTRLPGLYNDL